ncbi:Uncharacterised protein [Rothia kristinae]|nr:Uncharacterised protein [Rothia kristinae]
MTGSADLPLEERARLRRTADGASRYADWPRACHAGPRDQLTVPAHHPPESKEAPMTTRTRGFAALALLPLALSACGGGDDATDTSSSASASASPSMSARPAAASASATPAEAPTTAATESAPVAPETTEAVATEPAQAAEAPDPEQVQTQQSAAATVQSYFANGGGCIAGRLEGGRGTVLAGAGGAGLCLLLGEPTGRLGQRRRPPRPRQPREPRGPHTRRGGTNHPPRVLREPGSRHRHLRGDPELLHGIRPIVCRAIPLSSGVRVLSARRRRRCARGSGPSRLGVVGQVHHVPRGLHDPAKRSGICGSRPMASRMVSANFTGRAVSRQTMGVST